MNVTLTPEMERLINDRVNSGKYLSASEVIGEGLRLLEERDRTPEMRLAELKAKIKVGIEAADRGEVVDGEAVFDELEEDIRLIEAQMQQNRELK